MTRARARAPSLSPLGSHGLDLSMVTHIFLLSKIWDASLEAQVVSRAHRMGATGAVVVEQLIMEGTVEQQMHRGARAAADAAAGDKGKGKARAAIAGPPGAAAGAPEAGETKLQSVLRTMRLLRDDRDGAAAAARARAVVTTTPTREPPPTADAPAVKRVRFAP